jgi:hypothetical protein
VRFQPGFYAWVCILAACITLPSVSFVAGMKQTERAVRASELAAAKALSESQQAWCPMVITFDNAWRDNPPPTEAGKQIAAGMRMLRAQYHCDPPR